MKKKLLSMITAAAMTAALLAGCGAAGAATEPVTETAEPEAQAEQIAEPEQPAEETTEVPDAEAGVSGELMIAAAASLENCLTNEVIPLFNEKYPDITVTGMYDSSGKLQTQIEEGVPADVFFSASTKQTDALVEEGLIDQAAVVNLLENKIVLIVPEGTEAGYKEFADITKAEVVAIGDPESVPAGQYAQEALTNLGIWEEVLAKASLGTNVTEVLNWVAEGSADAGIVYATDAAQTQKVAIIGTAPADSVKPAVYPVAIIKDSPNPEAAKAFAEFLQTPEIIKVFEANGFTSAL